MRAHQGLERLPQAPKNVTLPIIPIWLPGWLCSRASCRPCLVNCTHSIHMQVAIHPLERSLYKIHWKAYGKTPVLL